MPAPFRCAFIFVCALIPLSAVDVGRAAEPAPAPAPAETSAAAPTVDLRTTFERGSEARYEISVQVGRRDHRSWVPQEGQATPSPTISTQETLLELTIDRIVREATDEGVIIEIVYDRIKIVRRDTTSAMEFDSTTPEEQDASSVLAPMIRPLVGASVFIEVNASGQIKSIRADEALTSAKDTAEMANQIMGRDPVVELIGPIIAAKLPPTTVKLGQTWRRVNTIPVAETARITVTRSDTLKAIENQRAVIDIAGDIRLSVDKDTATQIPDLKNAKMEGAMLWDVARGLLASYDITQSIQTEGVFDGMKIATSTESLTSIRMIDK